MTDPIPEHTHYPTLTLSHSDVSCKDVSIVGLDVKVYGLEEIKHNSLPIAAVIALHGRTNNQKQMAFFSYGLLGQEKALSKGKNRRRDMIVITLDLPNHGERTVDKNVNLAFDRNPRHLYDMAACVTGGCRDVSQVIDYIAAYLFPNGERVIDEYIATGVSMGGNVTWRLLREEPRINIAIPILGLPFESFARYVGARAIKLGFPFTPPTYPPSLRPLFESPVPHDAYVGKKILSLHGERDQLVPYHYGEADIETVLSRAAIKGEMEVWKQEGAGHVVTVEMVKRTAEWIWRWALSADVSMHASP
ncbi:MAG: hypothetical protein TREMPRED_000703 [Tremellales sp. Tagirdzhanova-0007]|nr:MAG: hypothetical protein TREMPRED_000703 [Tremellales sp. Tagirdzhanova-0007]